MNDPITVIEKYADAIPVPVYDIISQLGLGPCFERLDDNISGWIEREDDGSYRIVINDAHPLTRQRFTAAHELGHFIYHRDLLGPGTGDTRAYRAEQTPLPNAAIRPIHERQANNFAANLLMPANSIERLRAAGINDVAVMADRLGVSVDAMKIRLGS
ncbi:ImmA/IrrE family metallo-endopeptidase [Sphingomonas sp.]|jgi:Zn-dependent peptidase ImmA (M78 family)|uniref:ImmA/IrrE family metallo-endopeptidase n=1 Tax=Sphingomonas sp. TaxID=28214 RepID=UPI002E313882|nr:ImmA/IrrE family metallo-endopeptidase [Sphingomonas sp.]HEX4694207.1 ImmA/IrrE family metallo-endopeptidase [Sphingomonas sp.]